ncbi:hypothetical protein Dimus_038539 [Dionaea muscipula]
MEGDFTGYCPTKPPLFNGENYPHWKKNFELFALANDIKAWRIIKSGPKKIEKKVKVGDITTRVEKSIDEYIDEDDKVAQINHKATHFLYCVLGPQEFNRVSACQTAKEIWDLLEVTYEGTSQVKDTRISMLSQDYELFAMKKEESIFEMFTRFTNIINGLSALNKKISNKEKVFKILRSLPNEWEAKYTTIIESKDLATFTMNQLMGSLIAYELNLKRKNKVEDDSKKTKNLAFEATTSEKKNKKEKNEKIEVEEEEDSEEEKELALLSSKFKRFLRKRNDRKRFLKKNSYKREESSRVNQRDVICYNCQQPGHMAYECPHPKVEKSKNKNLYRGKKKSLLAIWMNQSEDESTDDDSSQNEVANFCFMAKEDTEDEDNEVTDDSYAFDEDIFFGYASNSKAFRIFNKRILVIEESIHVTLMNLTPLPRKLLKMMM